VRITPTEHPEATTVPEGNLTITPFTELRAELVPPTVKGRLRGRPRLAVDNLGNTKLTASITGSDNGDQLTYDLTPSNIQIEPGRAAFVDARLKPREIIWFGSKEERPYTLAVQRSGTQPTTIDGTYVQHGFLPRWLATALGLTLALTITFVMLWLAQKPQIRSLAMEKVEEAGATALPTPGPSPSLVAPPPDSVTEPSTSPSASVSAEGQPGGAGGAGGKQEKPEGNKEPEGPLPATKVLLRNMVTGRCADVPGGGEGQQDGPVNQSTCNSTPEDNQLWDLEVRYEEIGPEGSDLFQIRNSKDRLCLDLGEFGARAPSTPVSEYPCNGTTGDNQLWWLDEQEDGNYWIRNYASNQLCLDVAGIHDTNIDVRLTIFGCDKADDHAWQIAKR
ncbi:RICIN domain-containing protein, partial [Streptomyces sp. GC420]|uniref:RICIN domain-containing protein n=1 Tax=Streptomyces sp. GC420 TaxID=2697568 RepID=UPI001414F680